MNNYVFRYTFDNQWDDNPETQGVHNSYLNSYYQAAEEICREWDDHSAEYLDERSVWLLLEGDTSPRRYTVDIELERHYNACEE